MLSFFSCLLVLLMRFSFSVSLALIAISLRLIILFVALVATSAAIFPTVPVGREVSLSRAVAVVSLASLCRVWAMRPRR